MLDAEAASCEPEQLWSFTGRATAPPAGPSVHNCLILFLLLPIYFLFNSTYICLILFPVLVNSPVVTSEFPHYGTTHLI